MTSRRNGRAPLWSFLGGSLLCLTLASSGGGQQNEPRSGLAGADEAGHASGPDASLASQLADLLNAKVRSGHWGGMVVSLCSGGTRFARNAGVCMNPAS